VRVAEDLLGSYQHRIDGLTLTPGPKGIFDVAVNGEVIFSKHAKGRHAQPGEVLRSFRSIVGADVRPYGT
jgi:predicted Rdx family selenoprotein